MAEESTKKQNPENQDPSSQGEESVEVYRPQDINDLPKWNCRVEGTPQDEQWTVGEVFYLICNGPKAEFYSKEIGTKEKGKTEYHLKILDVKKQTPTSLEAQATTYVPQPHEFNKLFLTDQNVEVVRVEPFKLPVKSVIKQKGQKPYGPFFAMKLQYPFWIWLVLAAFVIVTLIFTLLRLNRRAQMKKVIDELKQHNTALGPFNQFNKDLRTLSRQYIFSDESWSEHKKLNYVERLDEIFRMYLLREFYIPALDWNSSLVVRSLSKEDKKRFPVYGGGLKKFLSELDRARKDSDKIQVHDCKQLTQMAKKVSQDIWKVRKNT
jgi:heme exporter protein D